MKPLPPNSYPQGDRSNPLHTWENIKRLYANINDVLEWLRGNTSPLVIENDSDDYIPAGSLCGFASTGALALADAASPQTAPLFVAEVGVDPGEAFAPLMAGIARVRTDGAGGFSKGAFVYVSTTAGVVSSTEPAAGNYRIQAGKSNEDDVDEQDRIEITFLPNLWNLRRI